MLLKIRKVLDYMKVINEKINNLWQSRRKDIGEKGLLWMVLFFTIIDIMFIVYFLISKTVIDKVLFGYFVTVCTSVMMLFLISYFYIYNKLHISRRFTKVIQCIYKLLLCLCFLICIPVIIILKIFEIIINKRAKKFENFENVLIIITIDLFAIIALVYVDAEIADYLASYFAYISNNIICSYPVAIFILLGLIKIDVDLINMVILKIMNKHGMLKINRAVSRKQRSIPDKLPTNVDIKKYVENRQEEIKKFKQTRVESLNWDLEYQKKTLWRFQLLCLVILFVIATFAFEILFKNQSDAINVITIFTLILLYLDKRKEWE